MVPKLCEGIYGTALPWTPPVRGVTAVISTVSAMPRSYQPGENEIQTGDFDGLMNLIEAAKAVGVNHFVYTSFSSQIDRDCPLRNAKRAVEQRLGESGLNYTILRLSYFMELWLGPARFDVANARAQIYGSGENPISWISLQDKVLPPQHALPVPAPSGQVNRALI